MLTNSANATKIFNNDSEREIILDIVVEEDDFVEVTFFGNSISRVSRFERTSS
jgi:hypothetical protein